MKAMRSCRAARQPLAMLLSFGLSLSASSPTSKAAGLAAGLTGDQPLSTMRARPGSRRVGDAKQDLVIRGSRARTQACSVSAENVSTPRSGLHDADRRQIARPPTLRALATTPDRQHVCRRHWRIDQKTLSAANRPVAKGQRHRKDLHLRIPSWAVRCARKLKSGRAASRCGDAGGRAMHVRGIRMPAPPGRCSRKLAGRLPPS